MMFGAGLGEVVQEEYEERFHGILCDDILEGKGSFSLTRCPLLDRFSEMQELLVEMASTCLDWCNEHSAQADQRANAERLSCLSEGD